MSDQTTNIEEPEEGVDDDNAAVYIGDPVAEHVSGQDAPPERDFEAEAREMGWKPKDEWHGDPDGWRDAEEFVKRGEEFLPYVRAERDRLKREREKQDKEFAERVKRLEATTRTALERQKAQHEAEVEALKARQRKAVEDGDTEAYDEAGKRLESLGAPPEVPEEEAAPEVPSEVTEWARENPWFNTDPEMRALAVVVAGRVADTGGDVKAQIAAAEAEVKRRYPERFAEPKPPRQTVETGGQPPRPRTAKGVSQLPREAREAFNQFVKVGVYKESDLPRYAKEYWEQFK